MQPLPPIEQYNVYSNNAFAAGADQVSRAGSLSNQSIHGHQSQHALPLKSMTKSGTVSKAVLHDNSVLVPEKRNRDAMVAEIFAAKKSMVKPQSSLASLTATKANGF